MAMRLQAMGQPNYERGFKVTLQEHMLELPLTWRKPQTVFVNFMSDLFHKEVPDTFIRRVFDVMNRASWHTFQVLTKRAERLQSLGRDLKWPDNIWVGVSVESRSYLGRINCLRKVPARVRFISFEPLRQRLGEIDLTAIDWVIVGGESGPGARPMEPSWVVEIRDQCLEAGVPFFFKQWGGVNKKKAGRLLDGRTWESLPATVTASRPVASFA
jgi:protein gp37